MSESEEFVFIFKDLTISSKMAQQNQLLFNGLETGFQNLVNFFTGMIVPNNERNFQKIYDILSQLYKLLAILCGLKMSENQLVALIDQFFEAHIQLLGLMFAKVDTYLMPLQRKELHDLLDSCAALRLQLRDLKKSCLPSDKSLD